MDGTTLPAIYIAIYIALFTAYTQHYTQHSTEHATQHYKKLHIDHHTERGQPFTHTHMHAVYIYIDKQSKIR